MTTQRDSNAPTIKGSWENQLETAQRLASDFKDEALPIYEKLFNRLGKMPRSQRMAANQRLQNIFMTSAVDYQGYLTLRGRYAEALAVVDRVLEEAPESERPMWQMHGAELLILAGQEDAAIARVKEAGQSADLDDLEALGDLFMVLIRLGRLDEAASTLEELTALVESRDVNDDARQRDRAYAADLATTLALERHDFDRAEALYAEAIALDPDLKQHLNRLYARFVHAGEAERALPYIKRDQQHPIRATFWHGLALQRLGEAEQAARQWEKVTAMDPAKTSETSFLEYILSLYYLDDPDGMGLGAVLNLLQEEGSNVWALFYLAGLGWALRDNLQNAQTNFQRAVNLRRANGQGRKLPVETWYFCVDLLEEEELAAVREFFEVEDGASTGSAGEIAADSLDSEEEA